MVLQSCYHPDLLFQLCLQDLNSFLHALVIDEELPHMFRHLPGKQYLIIFLGSWLLGYGFSVCGEHGWLQLLSIQIMQEEVYRVFAIGSREEGYAVHQVASSSFYSLGSSCRKALCGAIPEPNEGHFRDYSFPFNLQVQDAAKYGLRRIYEFYDKEFDIFAEDYFKESHLQLSGQEDDLPTFLSEFSMIDRQYIKTRFFTKKVNGQGFYQYFVRRNGEYHVEYIDDVIPVVGNKQVPAWGLSIKEPWKLILMKAWLKEKRGIEGVIKAQPYEFIEAFGLPGYRAISIKKELNHLRVSKVPEEIKALKEKRIKLNEPGFITVGKTRDNEKVRQLGLKKNRAGYKIVPIETLNASSIHNHNLGASSLANEENIYKIQSQLPVFWVGEYSVVSGKIRSSYNPNVHKLNIEKEFLATYSEISNVFSKFYVAPEYSSKYGSGNIIEDSYRFSIQEDEPYFIFELEVAVKGFLNLNVDLPLTSAVQVDGHKRYSPIKYFMARKKPEEQGGAKLSGYQFYDGEYVKGYHKSLNRFLQVNEGKYAIYVKIDNTQEKKAQSFAININTNAVIRKFQRNDELTAEEESEIIKSFFYEYSKHAGIKCYVHKEVKDLLVYICNKFDELGFAFISLYAHPKAKGSLALDINRKKLREHGIRVCVQAMGAYGEEEDNYKLIAKPGEPEVLVLERTKRIRSREEQFPPEGTIDFYEIY